MRRVIVVLMASLAVNAATGQPAAVPKQDDRALAMSRALQAYESSIESLEWRQVWYAPPRVGRGRSDWVLGDESIRAADTRWRVSQSGRMYTTQPPDWRVEYRPKNFLGDGVVRVAWDAGSNRGVVDDPDGFFAGGGNMLRVLGRYLDYGEFVHGRSAGALAEGAQRLEYLEPTDAEPWPGFRAIGAISQGVVDLEMRLDPERGFAPRVIRTPRQFDGAPAELLVVLEYLDAGGVWVPRAGVVANYYTERVPDLSSPVPDIHMRDFEAALTLDGLPAVGDRDQLRRWIREAHAVRVLNPERRVVHGPLVCFDAQEAVISPAVFFVTEATLNRSLTLDEMLDRLPEEATFGNAWTETMNQSAAQVREFVRDLLAPRE
jgi:hypothetical protein